MEGYMCLQARGEERFFFMIGMHFSRENCRSRIEGRLQVWCAFCVPEVFLRQELIVKSAWLLTEKCAATRTPGDSFSALATSCPCKLRKITT